MTAKELRKLTGLSQREFATLYGINIKTLRNWEQGQAKEPEYVLYLIERLIKEVDFKNTIKNKEPLKDELFNSNSNTDL